MNPENLLAHVDFVRGLARSLVLDESSAEDVAQQAFLAAIRHPPDEGKPIQSWFSRVVRNLAGNLFRGKVRRRRREQAAALPERAPSAAEVAEREEERGWAVVLAAILLHWLYHFNSGLGFLLGTIGFLRRRSARRLPDVSRVD